MKKNTIIIGVFAVIFIEIFTGCKKELIGPANVEPYKNLSDFTTSRVISNIPRIEYSGGIMKVYISVTDQEQNPIYNLNRNNFNIDHMIDNATAVNVGEITLQSSGGPGIAQNIAAALTMDYSGSMHANPLDIPAMENAVKYFISLKDNYDAMEIIKFDNNVIVASTFTTDTTTLNNAVDSTYNLGGSTAFFSACDKGLDDANAIVSNYPCLLPAIIGFTDGVNNQPPLTPDSMISKSIQYQIPIYTIGYGDPVNYADTTLLSYIADTTGGRFFWSPGPNDLQSLYQFVNGQLTSVYVVTFPFNVTGTTTLRIQTQYECSQGIINSVAFKTFNP